MTIYHENALRLIAAGYSAVPIAPGLKHPGFDGWQRFCTTAPTRAEIDHLSRDIPGAGIGLPGGFYTTPGTTVPVGAVTQACTAAELQTLRVMVQRTNGTMEYLTFVQTASNAVLATGSDYTVRLTVNAASTSTTCDIRATAASCDIYAVIIGNGGGRACFDLATNTAAGIGNTAGSGTGLNPTVSLMTGAWTAFVGFENRIQLGASAPLGDLHQIMFVKFVNTFNAGDRFTFRIDTDRIG